MWLITIVGTFVAAFYLGGRFYSWLEYDDKMPVQHRILIPLAIGSLLVCLYVAF